MGIQGLLPLLKECQRVTHVKEYKGQTLAVDAYVWLHRGAYGCAQELATGQQTIKYVKYAMHRIRLLKYHGVTPYVVFDGGLLPSKMGTENDREGRRTEALRRANSLMLEGKHAQAREYFVKAVDVTPQMAYQLIKALIAEGVSYVVAPYEADAQLAYLERKGYVDGIITEDSDLLVFGCKKVLFKMDSEGACVEICRDRFTMCRDFNFAGWTDVEFRQMAILSGCDYLDSISGLGIKTSHRLMRKYKTAEKVIRFVRLEGQLKVPKDYEMESRRAELTFLHQRVFCPETEKLVHLHDLPSHLLEAERDEMRFIGPDMPAEIARGIARGDLCPMSKEKMIDIAPGSQAVSTVKAKTSTTSTAASIKDFFKPVPSAGKSKKRPVLGESKKSNSNLFANTVNGVVQGKTSAPLTKSRFFANGPKIKAAPSTATDENAATLETPIGVTSPEELQETEESEGAVMQDEAEMDEDAEVYKLAEALTQAAEAEAEASYNGEEDDAEAEEVARQMDIESWNTSNQTRLPVAKMEQDVCLGERVASPLATCLTEERPATPTRSPLSDAGFSHISSPGNTAARSPSKRYQSISRTGSRHLSTKKEPNENEDPDGRQGRAPPSSPGFVCLTSPISTLDYKPSTISRQAIRPSTSFASIDLTDVVSSPEATLNRSSRVKLERKEVPLSPLRDKGSSAGKKRSRTNSTESHWSSEAITPSQDAHATLATEQHKKRSRQAFEVYADLESREANTPDSSALFAKFNEAKDRKKPTLKRCNGTFGAGVKAFKPASKAAPRKKLNSSQSSDSVEDDEEDVEGETTTDAKTVGLLAQWKTQFSFVKDQQTGTFHSRTPSLVTEQRQCRPPPASLTSILQPKRPLSPSPVRSPQKKSRRTPAAAVPVTNRKPQANISKTQRPPSSPDPIRSDSEASSSPNRSSLPDAQAAYHVSPSSKTKLLAFRFNGQPSSSGSGTSV